MVDNEPASASPWAGRVTLALAAVLVAIVVLTLPFVVRSMWSELMEGDAAAQYDGLTGELVSAVAAKAAQSDVTYFTIAVLEIDEAEQSVTLGLSGHRACSADCPVVTLTLFSLHDADQRRGLPASVTMRLASDTRLYSERAQLPLRGNPNVYPFDSYRLTLGLVLTRTMPDGTTQLTHTTDLGDQAIFTLQDNVAGLQMRPPRLIDPKRVQATDDPFDFLVVEELSFRRPAYQQLLAVLLVVLISTSAAVALFLRTVNDVVLGIGGLILGIWGVRSIVVPHPPTDVNAVDTALACVILLLLVALAVRTAKHYNRPDRVGDGTGHPDD